MIKESENALGSCWSFRGKERLCASHPIGVQAVLGDASTILGAK